jgi:hypothetical protein
MCSLLYPYFIAADVEITADNFMSVLEDGLVVCRLAKHIHDKAQDTKPNSNKHLGPDGLPREVPAITFSERLASKFHHRDNVCKFIGWARKFGINEECLFESDCLGEFWGCLYLLNGGIVSICCSKF